MNYPDTSSLILERGGSNLTIWFNRPEARNSLTKEVTDELCAVLATVKEDTSVRSVIFRGKGGVFCSGGDLKAFKAMGDLGDKAKDAALGMSVEAARFLTMTQELPQLTIAVVEGAAMAGGFGIACVADLLLTTKDAKFGLSEARIGLVAAQIAPYIIDRLGFARARKLMVMASVLNGQQLHDMGMTDYLLEDASAIESTLNNILKSFKGCAPGGVAATKQVLLESKRLQGEAFIEKAAELFADCLVSEEGQEGFQSFIEKRRPRWA